MEAGGDGCKHWSSIKIYLQERVQPRGVWGLVLQGCSKPKHFDVRVQAPSCYMLVSAFGLSQLVVSLAP
eukprot:5931559-Amphidinium_carterae.1